MYVTFDHSTNLTNNIKTFYFKSKIKIDYLPGQYIELVIPHKKVDERKDKRWFTLSSSPTEDLLSITTRITNKKSSFKNALNELIPGNDVYMSEPMGDFVLPKDMNIPIVFIVGGIGITPVRSMIKWQIDKQETRTAEIIYATNKQNEQIFLDLLLLAPLLKINLLTSEKKEKLTVSTIFNLVANFDHKYFYISGPEPMVEQIVSEFNIIGIDKRHIITDYFPGYESY